MTYCEHIPHKGIQMPIKSRLYINSNSNISLTNAVVVFKADIIPPLLHSFINAKIWGYLYFYYKIQVKQLFYFADFIGVLSVYGGMFTFGSCCQSAHILIVVPLNSQAKILKPIYYIIYNFIHKNQIQKISKHSKNTSKSFDAVLRQTPLFILLITQ